MASDLRETGRVEAFSDGVFAIAITLLVLDLKVPGNLPAGTTLLAALLAQWPAYVAFVTSFATIGIMWINHHTLFTLIRRTDHTLLLLNTLLLLGVIVVPFPTALVAAYLYRHDQQAAVMVYSGTFTVIAVFFNLLWRYASHGHRLLGPAPDVGRVRAITHAYSYGPPVYFASFLLAFVNGAASLALNIALAVFFALPTRQRT